MQAIIERLKKGEIIALVEWRGFKVESISMTDTKTGKQRQAHVVRHACEMGAEQIAISEWLQDDMDPKQVSYPFVKGDKLLVAFTSLSRTKGLWMGSGTFFPSPLDL